MKNNNFDEVLSAQKSKQMEFEEWSKNVPDPGPVLAGGPMNSPKPDLGPFRDPSTPSEDEKSIKLTEVCSTDKVPENTRILCLNFYARYEVPLYVTYLGNRSHFFVEIEQDSYVTIKYAAFISGYLAGQK